MERFSCANQRRGTEREMERDLPSGGLHDEQLAVLIGALVIPLLLSRGLPLHVIVAARADVDDSAAVAIPAVPVAVRPVRTTDDNVPENRLYVRVRFVFVLFVQRVKK